MAYEAEEIRTSQEIFYYLLEHHELREEDDQLLYKAYTEEESHPESGEIPGRDCGKQCGTLRKCNLSDSQRGE